MAFDNPLRQSVLSGLDDPENEFGAGFDIEMKTEEDPNVQLEEIKRKEESEAQAKKNRARSRRGRAMEAIANALVVFTSKDPARAAQSMIEMRMQMIEREKARMAEDARLDKQLAARAAEGDKDRGVQLTGIESREEIAETEEAGRVSRHKETLEASEERLTQEQRFARTQRSTAKADAYGDPNATPELRQQFIACDAGGNAGEDCNTPDLVEYRAYVAGRVLEERNVALHGTTSQLQRVDADRQATVARLTQTLASIPIGYDKDGNEIFRTPEQLREAVEVALGQTVPQTEGGATPDLDSLTKEAIEQHVVESGLNEAIQGGDIGSALLIGHQVAQTAEENLPPGTDTDKIVLERLYEGGLTPTQINSSKAVDDLAEQAFPREIPVRAEDGSITLDKDGKPLTVDDPKYKEKRREYKARFQKKAMETWYDMGIKAWIESGQTQNAIDFFTNYNIAHGMVDNEAPYFARRANSYMIEQGEQYMAEQAEGAQQVLDAAQ